MLISYWQLINFLLRAKVGCRHWTNAIVFTPLPLVYFHLESLISGLIPLKSKRLQIMEVNGFFYFNESLIKRNNFVEYDAKQNKEKKKRLKFRIFFFFWPWWVLYVKTKWVYESSYLCVCVWSIWLYTSLWILNYFGKPKEFLLLSIWIILCECIQGNLMERYVDINMGTLNVVVKK